MMNRIRRWPEEAMGSRWDGSHARETVSGVISHQDLRCTLFAPHHYEAAYAYPLLIWLHGPGDDERQVRRIMPHVSLRNYVAIGPRGCCPPDPGCPGYQWRQTDRAIEQAEAAVFESQRIATKKYHVASDRIFLAGYQCGGTMALRVALSHPGDFAGAISIGGPFPTGCAALSRLREARKLPILIARGLQSRAYPPEASRRELELFHAAAMKVTVRLYPCDGELTTQMLRDADQWMMARAGMASEPVEGVAVYPGESN